MLITMATWCASSLSTRRRRSQGRNFSQRLSTGRFLRGDTSGLPIASQNYLRPCQGGVLSLFSFLTSSPDRIFQENNGEREKNRRNGGGGGIRTPGTLSGPTVFKTAGFNRSPTPPAPSLTGKSSYFQYPGTRTPSHPYILENLLNLRRAPRVRQKQFGSLGRISGV
jgi:hypothetical protein